MPSARLLSPSSAIWARLFCSRPIPFVLLFTHRLRWRLFLQQIVEIGLLSQVVVMVTGGFTGAVFAAQTYFQFNKIGMGSATGAVVSVAICRELAPVLSALMVSGRVGAAMSAEIGTMKVTEQIDALRALAVYPVDYLVVPRALAMMISMPLLTAECIGFGIVASYLIAIVFLDINGTYYVANMVQLDPDARSHHGSIESVRFRDPDCFYFLSQRIDHKGGRSGSGAGHDRSGRDLFAGGSDFEFLPDDGAEYCLSGGISVKSVAAAVTGGRHGKDPAAETAAATSFSPLGKLQPFWRRGFFDHLIRNTESYAQKWDYVRENPVRAGLGQHDRGLAISR